MWKIKLQKILGNLLEELRKLHTMNGTVNPQMQVIENSRQYFLQSPNRYFTENSRCMGAPDFWILHTGQKKKNESSNMINFNLRFGPAITSIPQCFFRYSKGYASPFLIIYFTRVSCDDTNQLTYGIECACESADCMPLSHAHLSYKFEEVKDHYYIFRFPDAQFAVSTLPCYKSKI